MDSPLEKTVNQLQLILIGKNAPARYQKTPHRFAAALAPDGQTCAAWSTVMAPLPVGLALDCPVWDREQAQERPFTPYYMACCRRIFAPLLQEQAKFYYLRGAPTFAALRAAVLALGELTECSILVELAVENERGNLADGVDIVAAIGVLQRIGVSTVLLTATNPASLSAGLERVAPYARLSIGVNVHSAWLREQTVLCNTELFLPTEHEAQCDVERLLDAMEHHAHTHVPRDHDDFILAPDGREAHFIDSTIDMAEEIVCGPRLDQALIEAEETAGAIKLVLQSEDDVVTLEEQLYLLGRPLCLCAASAELLEKGLCVYPGLALYDGTWEQEPSILQYFERKYGMICL